ncbi:hypothetical protein C0995_010537 [Termitomyces sp. Mi166|nr:hypothetical protein C0995_010537 [Termitomyces sp. Mi166\
MAPAPTPVSTPVSMASSFRHTPSAPYVLAEEPSSPPITMPVSQRQSLWHATVYSKGKGKVKVTEKDNDNEDEAMQTLWELENFVVPTTALSYFQFSDKELAALLLLTTEYYEADVGFS